MSKKANQIVDDAIEKALKEANQKSTQGFGFGSYSEYDSNPVVEAAVSASSKEATKALNLAIAKSLDIGRRALNAYIQEDAEPLERDLQRVKEAVDVLDGTRSAKNLEKRAVRFEHLKSLTGMTSTPMYVKKAQGEAPTAEEFNALVEAFRELWGKLFEIEIQRRTHGKSPV